MEAYMWKDVDFVSSRSDAEIIELDKVSYAACPGKLLQDRWTSVAIVDQILHIHGFAHRQKFSAIGSSETLEVVLKALYTRIGLLGRIPNYRDQAVVICQLATLLLDTTRVPYYQEATRLFKQALRIARDNGFYSIESAACTGLGRIACLEGKLKKSLRLLHHAVSAAKLSEIAVYVLETNAIYELSIALGQSKDDSNTEELEELLDLTIHLRELYDHGGGVEYEWGLRETHIDNSSPIAARECIDPLVRPLNMSNNLMEHARLLFVSILAMHRLKKDGHVDKEVGDLCSIVVAQLDHRDPCARDLYDLLRRFRAIVLNWSDSETKDKTIAAIAIPMVTLLSHMAGQRRRYTEFLEGYRHV